MQSGRWYATQKRKRALLRDLNSTKENRPKIARLFEITRKFREHARWAFRPENQKRSEKYESETETANPNNKKKS